MSPPILETVAFVQPKNYTVGENKLFQLVQCTQHIGMITKAPSGARALRFWFLHRG